MAFRRDVAYLDRCVPEYVNLNGEEFLRVVRLLEAVHLDLTRAPTRVRWAGDASDLYASRLHEAQMLADDLREAYTIAGRALVEYAAALADARRRLADGDGVARQLASMMAPLIRSQTQAFRANEPLAQWEDLRAITSLQDRITEQTLQRDIDRIRELAEHHYRSAAHLYDQARDIDEAARRECVTRLREASRRLPDFVADSSAANEIVRTVPGMAAEMVEAAASDTGVRLPGQGQVPPYGTGPGGYSNIHSDIVERASTFDIDRPGWNPLNEHESKLNWIRHYRSVIQTAAQQNGIPADVLAGVIYNEVGGKPAWMDDMVDGLRQRRLYPGRPDDTSYGWVDMQVDTAAVALGYDPSHLSSTNRESIIASLRDPVQDIMIAAKVLGDAKDGTEFALVDPSEMTVEQGRRLAAVWNGGPNWDGGDAQRYAARYAAHRAEAAEALQTPASR